MKNRPNRHALWHLIKSWLLAWAVIFLFIQLWNLGAKIL